jgi:hypothetical protein
MSLPNRKQRRQLAKDLGLFKNKSKESSDRSKEMGKMINLRNLTEQRNKNRK